MSGSLIVVSAPSGAGKSSLVNALVASTPGLEVAVSHTTRQPRPGEIDGVHYHFVDNGGFQQMIQDDAFLEYARVFDNYYGTARSSLQEPLREGRDLLLEIDWQGARQVRELFPETVTLFILPPSLEALRERLKARGQDNDEIIERRMRDARSEASHAQEFDYLVINDVFADAVNELRCLVMAVRLRCRIQMRRHAALVNSLLAQS